MRLPGAPQAISGEVLRGRLIERLAGRWDVPVTTVVGGPGFGKSTALAQAVRSHAADPRGIEAWVTCEPGDEDARRLAAAVGRAFAADLPATTPLDTVREALRAASPIETCLILDDCHEIPAGSSGQRLLAELVARLPAGAHLVLCGRRLPQVPVARLHAADRIRCLTESDLAFDDGELGRAASLAARPATDVAGLGGWPALVRLTLAAPPGVAQDYLWDEVVSALSAADREALLHLAVLGSADAATLAALLPADVGAGALVPAAVDVGELAARIPLVARFGAGEVRAHPLWIDALVRILPADRIAAARARAADLLLARGNALRAGSIAIAAGDVAMLDRAAVALVATTLATFPADTGARWLAAVAEVEHHRPGLRLLTAATRYAGRADDPAVDAIVDAAFAEATAAGGADRARIAALSLATVAAHARGDESRLAELYQTALDLPGAAEEPTLRLLMAGVRGALYELMGSIEDALAAVEALALTDIAQQPGKIIIRFYVYLLLLAGRADEAARIAAEHLADSPYAHVRRMPGFARWMAGDPGGLLPGTGEPGHPAHLPASDANDRYRFNFLAFAAVVAASLGDRPALEHVSAQLAASGLGDDTRDAAMLATAAAAHAVLLGDESAARSRIAAFLAEHPLSDPVAAVHLRRFLAYGYVLSPEARAAWDTAPLGPSHQRVRAAARLLLAGRAGRLTTTGDVTPETVLISFPLPWAVELAAHADAAGLPFGRRLLQWLADRLGRRAHDALRPFAAGPSVAPLTGARRLLATVPATPASHTRVELLGPMRVLVDGRPADLRRRRVRELLGVLAVHEEMDRDRLTGLLWPDLDPVAAARNLRVTLTYLRRAVDADHLRCDRSRIRLVRSAALTVDVADLRERLDEAALARRLGDLAAAEAALSAAVALWRGEPLTDLAPLPGYDAMAAGLVAELTSATLTLGERCLARGDTTGAAGLARRALAAEPYAERCMRLMLAAETQRRDPVALGRAVTRVRSALSEIGARPEPATRIVLRQAELATR
ncbi:BTAD domain-containing putative transcriptional regulator [Actinoplanes sp. DH11]|uniref:BTAD domain-containing putative transcriptional regulator n=1 Tax=Actinoplanes sp. DH11 TaxID=2857011 RepID=UPI001E36C240|nr:BTAD domain-containing putative transcriptional regulator [Actinoplanes sp. DH11]